MQILVDADDHLHGSQDLMARIEGVVEGALERFSERIIRVEVRLSDLNTRRPGERDMCCHMEAHAGGLKPIAVSHEAVTLTEAIHAAASKLERALHRTLGRVKGKAPRAPAAELEDPAEGLGHLESP
jgi:ribosome-associated translation inhibitor RaiA